MADHIEAYIHGEGKAGALVHFRCREDMTPRTPQFRALAHDIAMHVVALKPAAVSPEELDEDLWQKELGYINRALQDADTPTRQARLIEQRKKFENEVCLLRQPFLKDPSKSVAQVVAELGAQLSDTIAVLRFTRYDANET